MIYIDFSQASIYLHFSIFLLRIFGGWEWPWPWAAGSHNSHGAGGEVGRGMIRRMIRCKVTFETFDVVHQNASENQRRSPSTLRSH